MEVTCGALRHGRHVAQLQRPGADWARPTVAALRAPRVLARRPGRAGGPAAGRRRRSSAAYAARPSFLHRDLFRDRVARTAELLGVTAPDDVLDRFDDGAARGRHRRTSPRCPASTRRSRASGPAACTSAWCPTPTTTTSAACSSATASTCWSTTGRARRRPSSCKPDARIYEYALAKAGRTRGRDAVRGRLPAARRGRGATGRHAGGAHRRAGHGCPALPRSRRRRGRLRGRGPCWRSLPIVDRCNARRLSGAPAATGRRRGRPRAVERRSDLEPREEILRHAAALFSTAGVGATRITDIAASVGMTPPALYHYFDNLDAIVEALLELRRRRVGGVRHRRGEPARALRRAARAPWSANTSNA